MSNKKYTKGRRKEYKVCAQLRKEGYEIVQRSAGSKSPVDIFAIHKEERKILFIQVKPDSMTERRRDGHLKVAAKRIYNELGFLYGMWNVDFELR